MNAININGLQYLANDLMLDGYGDWEQEGTTVKDGTGKTVAVAETEQLAEYIAAASPGALVELFSEIAALQDKLRTIERIIGEDV